MQQYVKCSSCLGRGSHHNISTHEDATCRTCGGEGRVPVPPPAAPPVSNLVVEQVAPKPTTGPAVWGLVMRDFAQRDEEGCRKYGVPLRPLNGRSAPIDAYQEALDLVVYMRQMIEEVGLLRADLEALLPPLRAKDPALEDALRGIIARYKLLTPAG